MPYGLAVPPALERKALEVLPERAAQIVPLQSELDGGFQEAQLVARIITFAVELEGIDRPLAQQVPQDVIRSIVDVARGTASWCNVQPWDLVITSGESTDAFRDALVGRALPRGARGQ